MNLPYMLQGLLWYEKCNFHYRTLQKTVSEENNDLVVLILDFILQDFTLVVFVLSLYSLTCVIPITMQICWSQQKWHQLVPII